MARFGFVPRSKGYREVLKGDDAYRACDSNGRSLCQTANMAGHGEYVYDTMRGKERIHTRVKTADAKAYFQERKTRVLDRIVAHYGRPSLAERRFR